MTETVCLIPRDVDDRQCTATTSFIAALLGFASSLDIQILAVPSGFADPREAAIDEAYVELAGRDDSGRVFLSEAVSVTSNPGDTAIGVLLAGVGLRRRDHQYRGLIDLANPLDGATELVIGLFRCGILDFSHFDQIKLLEAPLFAAAHDFLTGIAGPFVDRDQVSSARLCWTTALTLTESESFEASYSLATSLLWDDSFEEGTHYLDLAEQAASNERQQQYVRYQRGMAALRRNQLPAAQGHFRAVLNEWPACGMAWVGLAYALAASGERVDALVAVRRLLAMQTDEAPELGDARGQAEALLRELGT